MEESQSLKDQGKSRTKQNGKTEVTVGRNPLKIRASLEHGITMDDLERYMSQSLKDQGKSRTD